MGATFGYGAIYTVRAYTDKSKSGEFGYASFEGERAFSDASDHFERLKRDPDSQKVWMTRLDGGDWVFVDRLQRNEQGQWEPDAS